MRSIGTQYLVLNRRSSCKHEFETWPRCFLTIPYRIIKMTGRAAYICMICYYAYEIWQTNKGTTLTPGLLSKAWHEKEWKALRMRLKPLGRSFKSLLLTL